MRHAKKLPLFHDLLHTEMSPSFGQTLTCADRAMHGPPKLQVGLAMIWQINLSFSPNFDRLENKTCFCRQFQAGKNRGIGQNIQNDFEF